MGVNYEPEATMLGELGNPMFEDHKESQEIIWFRSLNRQLMDILLYEGPVNMANLMAGRLILAEAEIQTVQQLEENHLHDMILKTSVTTYLTSTPETLSKNLAECVAESVLVKMFKYELEGSHVEKGLMLIESPFPTTKKKGGRDFSSNDSNSTKKSTSATES